jgi:hypothetical protein
MKKLFNYGFKNELNAYLYIDVKIHPPLAQDILQLRTD